MADSSQIISDSQSSVIKLQNSLQQLVDRVKPTSDSNEILGEALTLFKTFYSELGSPEFIPIEFKNGDTARSELYNLNLSRIFNDISRFYKELNNLAQSNIKSFNYAQVVVQEVKKRAEAVASMVLDLNILNNFTRGDVIVAGDDFINKDYIDTGAGLGSTPAEIISNGSGVGLAKASSVNLTENDRVKIEVLPISPAKEKNIVTDVRTVNTKPTPGNFERFYEGNYYNFLGAARPEGGEFNIQFTIDPNQLKNIEEVSKNGEVTQKAQEQTKGVFLEYGASEEARALARKRMIDGNPDTFWECEYVVKLTNPLVPDPTDSMVTDEQVENPEGSEYSNPEAPDTASIQIDVNDLNTRALAEDTIDLIIDVIVTLPEDQNINFVAINPVVFSKNAFIEVEDIATIDSTEGEFRTVDGWQALRFAKTITPEANEYLTDSQLSATLSPNRYNYTGQGIYPFPTRVAKKIKVRLKMSQPASQPYEKTYALLKNTIEVDTTITTTTTKGRFRF